VIDKIRARAFEVVEMVPSGASVGVGGFGLAGVPMDLCDALCELNRRDLHIVANNAGIDPTGVGRLAQEGRIRKFTGSFPANPVFFDLLMRGEVELELIPQGTLAERLRAAGCGIPAFYTPTGAGTMLGNGEYPSRYSSDGSVLETLPARDVAVFNGKECVLEHALPVDFALVKAHRADRIGNLSFRLGSRNFNPLVAMAAETTIVETEHIMDAGDIDPDLVHLPGVFVQHVVQSSGRRPLPNPPANDALAKAESDA